MIEYNKEIKYKEYIELCKTEEHDEDEYLEIHHYIPRFYRPDLIDEPSNLVMLTPEEHFIAHYILAKEWPKAEAIKAVNYMSHLIQFGAEYTDADINRIASIHGASRRKAHDNACEPQVLLSFPGFCFVKRFSSIKKAEEQIKETTNGFGLSTVKNKLCPYRIMSEEDYYDNKKKPVVGYCVRETPFAIHNIHQQFSNIEEASVCIGFSVCNIEKSINDKIELSEEHNKWQFKYLY